MSMLVCRHIYLKSLLTISIVVQYPKSVSASGVNANSERQDGLGDAAAGALMVVSIGGGTGTRSCVRWLSKSYNIQGAQSGGT